MKKPDFKILVDIDRNQKEAVRFIANGYTLYFNAQHLLIQLSPKERAFFDYLCEEMRFSDNNVFIDEPLKRHFIERLKRITNGKVTLTVNAVNKYVQNLNALGLIVRLELSKYIVNPKYAYKGSGYQRKEYLKRLIQRRISMGIPAQAFINQPEEEFLSKKTE